MTEIMGITKEGEKAVEKNEDRNSINHRQNC